MHRLKSRDLGQWNPRTGYEVPHGLDWYRDTAGGTMSATLDMGGPLDRPDMMAAGGAQVLGGVCVGAHVFAPGVLQ